MVELFFLEEKTNQSAAQPGESSLLGWTLILVGIVFITLM